MIIFRDCGTGGGSSGADVFAYVQETRALRKNSNKEMKCMRSHPGMVEMIDYIYTMKAVELVGASYGMLQDL